MIFRSGKHEGKSLELVKKIDPSYIAWCEINCPNILKEKKSDAKQKTTSAKPQTPPVRKEVSEDSEVPPSSIQPNLEFLRQTGDYQFYKKEDDKS